MNADNERMESELENVKINRDQIATQLNEYVAENEAQRQTIERLVEALREAEHRLNWIADSGDCSMSDDSVIECRYVRDDIRAALEAAAQLGSIAGDRKEVMRSDEQL